MNQEITYNGVTANSSDYTCPDGQLSLAIGAVPEDGALKPVMQPGVEVELQQGQNVMLLHKTSDGKTLYIVYGNNALSYIDSEDTKTTATISNSVTDLATINVIGNTLIAYTASQIYYFVWKPSAGSYTFLGNHLPDVQLSFGLVGHPRFWSVSGADKDEFNVRLAAGISYLWAWLRQKDFNEDNKKTITEQVMAKVNKFIADETVNKGRFCFPFLLRYALRLYDGSLVMHSAPILMNPATRNVPVVWWTDASGSDGEVTSMRCDIMLIAASLDYTLYGKDNLSNWTDIVSSVDVFITKPIYTYDQNGEIERIKKTDDYDTKFIGRLYATNGSADGRVDTAAEDKLVGAFADYDFLSAYTEWKYSNIYSMYKSAERRYPAELLDMPGYSEEKLREDIESESVFYKLCSIPVKDLANATIGTRKDITINNEYLQSLTARETMTDDYLSHDQLLAKYSFAYNSRMVLSGLTRKPFAGFEPACMFAHITKTSATLFVDDDKTVTISLSDGYSDLYSIMVHIKENGEEYVVGANYTYASMPCYRTEDNNRRSWGSYIYYPNANAYKMVIRDDANRNAIYEIELKPHDFLNGAFAFIGYEQNRLLRSGTLPTATADPKINIFNKVYNSEVNNPFYFPATGIVTVGTGEIMGVSAATKALSQGQFGQFPLYAFTTEGVWALEVSSTGTFSARQPISREVCLSSDSITQMDTAVLFATDRGIMIISGSEVACISEQLRTDAPFKLDALPRAGVLIDKYNAAANADEQLDATLQPDRLADFIAASRMVYDYSHQRVVVYNPTRPYAYVYSLESRQWGMMRSQLTATVNAYPRAMAMDNQHRLVDFTHTDNTHAGLMLITRPVKLGMPDRHKTVDSIIQRAVSRRGNLQQVLYGSNDLLHWHIVWSSNNVYLRGFSGDPYKYYRIAVMGRMQADESLTGFSVDFRERMTNQLR